MPVTDCKGRLFNRLNLIDLLVVVVVAVLVVVAYARLTAAYRPAPPYFEAATGVWVRAEIRVPAERDWLRLYIRPGLRQLDPRSGEPIAEVLGCDATGASGDLIVTVRLRGVRGGEGRLFYGNDLLLPGRELRIDTEACYIEGVVSAVSMIEDPVKP